MTLQRAPPNTIDTCAHEMGGNTHNKWFRTFDHGCCTQSYIHLRWCAFSACKCLTLRVTIKWGDPTDACQSHKYYNASIGTSTSASVSTGASTGASVSTSTSASARTSTGSSTGVWH